MVCDVREKPASEVYVTGTFDDWKQTVKLEHDGTIFQKTVTLPSSDKIYYKVNRAAATHARHRQRRKARLTKACHSLSLMVNGPRRTPKQKRTTPETPTTS